MLKQSLLFIVGLFMAAGMAFAEVDVNKADQAALDGVRGIGPSMSKRILEERQKGGGFKDWSDLEKRVKGIKEKSAMKLSANGLTVNGQPKPGASGQQAKAEGKAPRGDKSAKSGAMGKEGDAPDAAAKAGK
ncbi:MAG: hypothetical protein GAK35_02422 [Herbaspirillum frisingense]|uniref:Helix-hairpin-helix domain-containing protein n=1 Tax=Herbaspirillum frisingense TaxID=92645 RepID=A0A7V8FW36_9BURK|nr:MAG: hypothetical protein GAK35_02422 [Herbaspirillum frisingense]